MKIFLIIVVYIIIGYQAYLRIRGKKNKTFFSLNPTLSSLSFWIFFGITTLLFVLILVSQVRQSFIEKDFETFNNLNANSISQIEISIVNNEAGKFSGNGITISSKNKISQYFGELIRQETFDWNHPQTEWAAQLKVFDLKNNIHGFMVEKTNNHVCMVSYYGLNPNKYKGLCISSANSNLEQMIINDFNSVFPPVKYPVEN